MAKFDFGSRKGPIPPFGLSLLSQKLVKGNERVRNTPLPGPSPPQTLQDGHFINPAKPAHVTGAVMEPSLAV